MKNTIVCPNCNKEIEISEAFEHELSDKLRKSLQEDYESKLKIEQGKALLNAKHQLSLELEDKENESKELKKQNEKLHTQILEMNKTLRMIQQQSKDKEIELQKQLSFERGKIQQDVTKKTYEEFKFKDLEKEKMITDLKKSLDEARRKADQGSQQTQGELLELDFEKELNVNFPNDKISETKKGARGADIIQQVKTPMGKSAGKIIWEMKRTKNWEDKWIDKLKSDQREEKAEIAVIISQILPKETKKEIVNINKVWVATYPHAITLAGLLRDQLLSVAKQKAISSKSASDAQTLFDYMTGYEFANQMEAIIETYLGLNEQIIKEKMAFEKQWKQREMQLTKMYKSVLQIAGSLTGIAGPNMPQIKGIDVSELDTGKIAERKLL